MEREEEDREEIGVEGRIREKIKEIGEEEQMGWVTERKEEVRGGRKRIRMNRKRG